MCDVKRELESYNSYKSELKYLSVELEHLKENDVDIKSCPIGERVQTSNIGDPTANFVVGSEQRAIEIKKEMRNISQKIRLIDAFIKGLEEIDKRIIEYKFKKNYNYAQIGRALGCSSTMVQNHIEKSLKELEFLFENYYIPI